MSSVGANRWLRLDLAPRQKKIADFYKSNNKDLAREFLAIIRAQQGYGVYASNGPNYRFAVFGRDSIIVAEDLLETHQAMAKEIIFALASLQGREFNLTSEEEPGKIHHEYRSLYFSGRQIPIGSQKILRKLGPQWGGDEKKMLYYGSYDATPLFVRLVQKYCELYGLDILDQVVPALNDKSELTLFEHVYMAATWIVEKVTASPWKLLEFKRLNPAGLYNQAWMDSTVAYLHSNGTTANSDAGVASIEIQGYVYDALRAAAEIVATNTDEANSWRHLASIVRNNTVERLWMDDKKYFAMALDRERSGLTRQVDTLSSNVALLLESDIFRLTPYNRVWHYIESIVKTIFSKQFITPVGPRLRSLEHVNLIQFADYHGSLVSWPKQTHAIARGLRLHGFYKLAALLDTILLDSIGRSGEFYEFYFVGKGKGERMKYHYRHEDPEEPSLHEFGAADIPEPGQAWTISAVINTVHYVHQHKPSLPVLEDVQKLEQEVLNYPHVKVIVKSLGKLRDLQ